MSSPILTGVLCTHTHQEESHTEREREGEREREREGGREREASLFKRSAIFPSTPLARAIQQ